MAADQYNYTSFPVESDIEDFASFPMVMHVGDRAPDPVLTDLDSGQAVRLSDITKQGLTIAEFGSLT
jgi:hypothetical protein